MSAWANSTRRARLPKDWTRRVKDTKQAAQGRCQATVHEPECDGVGTDCDHVQHGDNHALSNLQWLSEPCHKAKTLAERPQRRRTERVHPGAV